MASFSLHQLDTGESIESAESEITILDPNHPLFGCTFPLLEVVANDAGDNYCLIRLPNGNERSVPLQVTDRSPQPIEYYPIPLSLTSVECLLETFAVINGRFKEDEQLQNRPEAIFAPEESIRMPQDGEKTSQEQPAASLLIEPEESQTKAHLNDEINASDMPVVLNSEQINTSEQSAESLAQEDLSSENHSVKLIKLGDAGRYLGVSKGLGFSLVAEKGLQIIINPLDKRYKLVSSQELDSLKEWVNEMKRTRGNIVKF